jgi:hypothetical protein
MNPRTRKMIPESRPGGSLPLPPVSRLRHGIAGIVVVLFTVVLCVGGMLFWLGSRGQDTFDRHLMEGYGHIESDRPAEAIVAFHKADQVRGVALRVYRAIKGLGGAEFTTDEELAQVIVSAAIMQAYEDFFAMKPSAQAVAQAQSAVERLHGPGADEFKAMVATARAVSHLCEKFQAKAYDEVMRGILAAEKAAIASDQDFFIQEVRMLIACGKAMNEPEILNRARELLFVLSTEMGIKSPRVDKLWGLFSR